MKDPRQRVVVALRDRIELVVVASCASQSQSQEGSSYGIDLFVDDVRLLFHRIFFGKDFGSQSKKARGRCRGPLIKRRWNSFSHISRNLPANKVIEGEVGVPRLDHPVAISKRMRVGVVFIASVGIAVTRDVQPVTRPTLAIKR